MRAAPVPKYLEFHREVRILGEWRPGVLAIQEVGYFHQENPTRISGKKSLQIREKKRTTDGRFDGGLWLDGWGQHDIRLDLERKKIFEEQEAGPDGRWRRRWRRCSMHRIAIGLTS